MPNLLNVYETVHRNTRWRFVQVIVMSMWIATGAVVQPALGEPGAVPAHSANVIRLSISDAPRGSLPYRLGCLIFTEAFERLGYGVELHVLPLERALLEANAGRMDGDAARIEFDRTIAVRYTNLIRVPEQVIQVEVVAYATDQSIHLSSWMDLAHCNCHIGHPRGYKIFEQHFQNHPDKNNIVKTRNVHQGLKMLQYGRIDVFVCSKISAEMSLASPEFMHSKIAAVATIDTAPVFPYLHRKHMALVPRLANALQAMKSEGLYKRLLEKAERLEPRLDERDNFKMSP